MRARRKGDLLRHRHHGTLRAGHARRPRLFPETPPRLRRRPRRRPRRAARSPPPTSLAGLPPRALRVRLPRIARPAGRPGAPPAPELAPQAGAALLPRSLPPARLPQGAVLRQRRPVPGPPSPTCSTRPQRCCAAATTCSCAAHDATPATFAPLPPARPPGAAGVLERTFGAGFMLIDAGLVEEGC